MSSQAQVFQTNSPSRWKKAKWTFRIFLFIALFLLVIVSLAVINGSNPSMPNLQDKGKIYQNILDPSGKLTLSNPQNKKYKGFKDLLEKRKQENFLNKKNIAAGLIRAGFYTPWSITSLPDLKK